MEIRLKNKVENSCLQTEGWRKLCFTLLFLLCLFFKSFAQPGAEIGIMGGVGYYTGEYNIRHLGHMQCYGGGLYRYNLNDRFAIRLNAGFSKIDISEKFLLSNDEVEYPSGFYTKVRDISALVEFNFRSFMVRKVKESSCYSPYLFLGIGFLGTEDEGSISIPLGIGVKFNLFKQFSCGLEWGARKLFTDKIDKLEDPWKTGETNFLYNKDFFFVLGLTLTYRFPINRECYF